ncbi:WXG100 family type VII secretion target [Streptomyces sp. MP131-18]|uniref:WXG100 family type VII secretion target n=1 Tax=Streptomyces sp. MP131-18 TaxID=1857892 RepID=UPI0009A16651|nr:WXG100 family type VII secretion target [Streptomyces sp. MP131-18]ONK14082.1 hypothetical protein STBA_48610 [Streptomyces sp. MP131-18]
MSDRYPHLGFDPCPGDLDAAETVARTIRDVTSQGSTTHTTLSAINSSNGIWVGRSADAFTESFDELPPYLQRAVNSLDAAARALEQWANDLDGFQARARALEEEAASAQQAVSSAQAQVDGLPSDTEGMDDDELERHEEDAERRQGALTSANAALEEIRSRAQGLNSEYISASDATAGRLANAADEAPPEPGLFDKIGDFIGGVVEFLMDPDTWKLIGDLFSDIAAIAGVICAVILIATLIAVTGGAALPALVVAIGSWAATIGAWASLGALVFHGIAMAGGADVGWMDLGLDAIGVFAAGIGIVGGAFANAGRVGIAAGRSMRAIGGAGNWFRGMGQSMDGWVMLASGRMFEVVGLIGGLGAWGASQNRRMEADGTTWNDIPVIGPLGDLGISAGDTVGDAMSEDGGDAQAASAASPGTRPFNASQALTSAGTAFTSGLSRQDVGVVA